MLIQLPKILAPSGILLEEAIKLRRSKRAEYKPQISFEELSRLLFSAQGITSDKKRAVASAGMAFPLELYIIAKNVETLKQGLYKYLPDTLSIELIKEQDFTQALENACGKYAFVTDAPVNIIIAADFRRTTRRFAERGIMYVHMEAGSAYQNISLEAVNLGLGTVVVGAFDVKFLKESLNIALEPLCILPVG
ncbi:MAG: SagB/ThcOx family dehydrogenase [Nanoarchaeota archaeon]